MAITLDEWIPSSKLSRSAIALALFAGSLGGPLAVAAAGSPDQGGGSSPLPSDLAGSGEVIHAAERAAERVAPGDDTSALVDIGDEAVAPRNDSPLVVSMADGRLQIAASNAVTFAVEPSVTGPNDRAPVVVGGAAVVGEAGDHGIVQAVQGGFRFTRVLDHPDSAAERTDFEVDLPTGWSLALQPTGAVFVRDEDGSDVGVIEVPWAVDVKGELLPTRFTVAEDGGRFTLQQHVDLPAELDRYPIAIDPRYTSMSDSIPHTKNGTARNYMRGYIRPEKDIAKARGYYPVWGNQHGVLRAVRRDGECGVIPDTAADYDFQVPCKSHDYCYDLRRTGGYDRVTRLDCDDEFKAAMYEDCNQRPSLIGVACRRQADVAYDAVRKWGS